MRQRQTTLLTVLIGMMMVFTLTAHAAVVDFKELVKSASPAVVHITFERTEQNRFLNPRFHFRMSPDMERFMDPFGMFGDPDSQPRSKVQGTGSGFIISPDGYIVTNNHVIEGADTVRVFLNVKEGTNVKELDEGIVAEVIGADPDTDLALLKIKKNGLPYLRFGDSDALEVGEWVLAIGSPYGLNQTVTAGIVSGKGRKIRVGKYDDFVQTDASINSGNSGGPLLNMNGEVIGINSVMIRPAQGIGFAIPSGMAKRIIEDLRENKKVSRGWLGISLQNIDVATAKALQLPNSKGALINSVLPGEPADKAGLQAGDVVLAVNGQAIDDVDQLLLKVAMLTPGKEAQISLWREGKKIEKMILVAERGLVGAAGAGSQASESLLGLKVRPLDQGEKEQLRLSNGLLVTDLSRDGIAAKLGLRRNDIILSVNQKTVKNVDEFNAVIGAVKKSDGPLLLLVSREGQTLFLGYDFGGKK